MARKAPRVGEAERGSSTADQQAQSSGVLNLVCFYFSLFSFTELNTYSHIKQCCLESDQLNLFGSFTLKHRI